MNTNWKFIEKIEKKKLKQYLYEKSQLEFKEKFIKKEDFKKGKNAENLKEKQRRISASEYKKSRRENDPYFNFVSNLRSRITNAFKLYSKNGKTNSCKEYGIDFDAIFLEIGNRPDDTYHLDHIIPISLFDLDNPEHVRLAHVPRNLRWLPGKENLEKSDNIDFETIICSLQLRTTCLTIGVDIFDKTKWM